MPKPKLYSETLKVPFPEGTIDAIVKVTGKRFRAAGYVRAAVLEKLAADGCPLPLPETPARTRKKADTHK